MHLSISDALVALHLSIGDAHCRLVMHLSFSDALVDVLIDK